MWRMKYENSMPERVLLCCYGFPPNTGIGGRRWAKLAKGLAQNGTAVEVINADLPKTGASPWSEDVSHPLITVHSVPSDYPTALSHNRGGVLGRLQYRLTLYALKRREAGTVFDVACGWEPQLQAKALEIIDKYGIAHVLATGAPFNLLYYATRLKTFRPNLHVLCDYRDPWMTAQNYGMSNLETRRKAEEQKKQDFVFANADVITAPNTFLCDEIVKSGCRPPLGKVRELPHFYDPDDIPKAVELPKSGTQRLVYGGALYLGLEPAMEQLQRALEYLELHAPSLWEKLEIDMYTPDFESALVQGRFPDKVRIHPAIGKAFFAELEQADAALVFLADHNRNFLTTKYFEYLPFQKPILYFGPAGHVSATIEEQGIGHVVSQPQTLVEVLEALGSKSYSEAFTKANATATLQTRTEELLALMP